MTREMQLPRKVVIGSGVLEDVGSAAADLGLEGSAAVITGPTTRDVAGDLVAETLSEEGFSTAVEVVEEINEVTRGSVVGDSDMDLFLGVGGGRCIDAAKLAAYRNGVPFLSVPTAASHDGVASNRASFGDGGSSKSVAAEAPLAVVADLEIISDAPERLMRSGCADILSNSTAVLDWGLADRLKGEYRSGYASTLSEMTARIITREASSIKPGLEESSKVVTKGLISSGVAMSIAGTSRPASGAEHMFSHALDGLAPEVALHGEQCGVGSIMTMFLHDGDWRSLRSALEELGAPTSATELGVEGELVLKALTKAHEVRPERYTILGSDGITWEAAEKVASETEVI